MNFCLEDLGNYSPCFSILNKFTITITITIMTNNSNDDNNNDVGDDDDHDHNFKTTTIKILNKRFFLQLFVIG